METYFAVTAPGFESLTSEELVQIGLTPEPLIESDDAPLRLPGEEGGGVTFSGERVDLYRANLHLRTASRILVRLGEFFAAGFPELRRKASRLAWEKYLKPGQPVRFHVTCHKSRLYHSAAVAERICGAIGDRLGQESVMMKGDETASGPEPQLIVVRLVKDHCTISVDSSGELLHRRGYRLETAKAPLRETIAAAMIMASGWNGTAPLLDPFCGSGTIAIEAALRAAGIPSGKRRKFQFMEWPGFKPKDWRVVCKMPTAEPANPMPQILASDRDAGAIRIAQANAERAGVAKWIEFSCRAVSAIEPPEGSGWIVTNPPYGVRVSANKDLRNLYAQFGNVMREHCPGWRIALLSNDMQLFRQTGIQLDTSMGWINGGIAVRLGRGIVR
jgi:putative N6-adenine-specific DNA methylase